LRRNSEEIPAHLDTDATSVLLDHQQLAAEEAVASEELSPGFQEDQDADSSESALSVSGQILEEKETIRLASYASKSRHLMQKAQQRLVVLTSLGRLLYLDEQGKVKGCISLQSADFSVSKSSATSINVFSNGKGYPFEFSKSIAAKWVAAITEAHTEQRQHAASSSNLSFADSASSFASTASRSREEEPARAQIPSAPDIIGALPAAPIATMIGLVGSARSEVNAAATVKYRHMLDRDENVMLVAIAEKTRYMRTQRRLLVLTDRPRLFYADAETDKVKGFISLRANDLDAKVVAPDSFVVMCHGKEYPFDLPDANADHWVKMILAARDTTAVQ
jgi:hypothetical protein